MPTSSKITVGVASDNSGVPRRTIRYAIANGNLKASKLPGSTGAYLIAQRDLNRWLAKREAKAQL